MENGRHRVWLNLAFGFVLKSIEDGMCRYFYAHENNTIMKRSIPVCTQADMTNLKDRMQKMDVVDICTRERTNTKWKFYKLTTLTFFASLLNDVPMGCKDTVLPEPLLENHNMNCVTFGRNTLQPYNDNLCLFRALALNLHGNKKLEEETPKILNLFLNNSEERDPSKFQSVHITDSESGRLVTTQYLPLWHWFCGWRTDWSAVSKKYSNVWKERQIFTIQQSDLLRQQHQCIVQSTPVYYVQLILLKDGEPGTTISYF